ncbi:MAG: DUF928 domain-containing protein [Oscillatoria sp. PMC 1051.18]|uniref:DUF928 domain-containing protein n=1 Tax=Oscillatoria salina TaxID=331517 RepID=UPI0013BB223C|nr:DUF928 domain-containing protein [Oscillatoria salina]MBZ8179261.1 DUF928 domain-containing protein [Oscillatoria salina IIICB1]MEC4893579.1 DUF928 domain-containing protein [Oscillatoria sp. PMC 1050.18]MEC5030053.1 DUF928 domain-containing protein [Oscillatoria sp. PMC 1051.18]NET86770.1 DUF928 domain-containing protein [Kamptonema sp. SIO1D9]
MTNLTGKLVSLSLLAGIQLTALISEQPFTLAQAFKPSRNAAIPARRRLPPPRASGDCALGDLKLTPLVPGRDFGMPLTASANPAFYIYVPQSTASRFEFALFDGRTEVYSLELPATSQAGILRLPLPETVSLEAGEVNGQPKVYQWFFSIVCDEDDRSADLRANGWVHRVADIAPATQTATDFAELGLWYDALDAAYAEQSAPVLLNSVGLEQFSAIPLVE